MRGNDSPGITGYTGPIGPIMNCYIPVVNNVPDYTYLNTTMYNCKYVLFPKEGDYSSSMSYILQWGMAKVTNNSIYINCNNNSECFTNIRYPIEMTSLIWKDFLSCNLTEKLANPISLAKPGNNIVFDSTNRLCNVFWIVLVH